MKIKNAKFVKKKRTASDDVNELNRWDKVELPLME